MTSHNGPLTLVDGDRDDTDVELAARIAARFGQGREAKSVNFEFVSRDGIERELQVVPFTADEVPQSWYL